MGFGRDKGAGTRPNPSPDSQPCRISPKPFPLPSPPPPPPSWGDPGALAPCPPPEQGTGDPYLDTHPRLHICGPHLAPLPPIRGGPSSRNRAPQENTPGVQQLPWDSRGPWTPTLHQRPERGVEALANEK